MLVVLEDNVLPFDKRLLGLQGLLRREQALHIIEDLTDISTYAVLLIGLLRHSIERYGDVIQAASDKIININPMWPVEI